MADTITGAQLTHRMKILLKIMTAVVLTSVSLYLFAPWEFALYYLKPLPDTVLEQVEDAAAQDIDGIIVYVQKGHQPAETYAAGWHDRQKKIAAKPDALFKIGSIRKLYDAAALAKLSARGVLSPDDTLADHMPALKGRIEYADKITLRMMVQHRSGIPNYTDQEGFDWGKAMGRDELLGLVLDQPADFAPDSDYGYSNTNYLLLRRIMSQKLGYSHDIFIRDQILVPLNLNRTFFSVSGSDPKDLMSGYHVGYSLDFKDLDHGFVATAADVGTFLRALNDGSLFTDAERSIYASLYEYGHTGWVLGHSSRAHYHPDMDTVVIQFVNTTGNDTVILTGIVYDRIIGILRQR